MSDRGVIWETMQSQSENGIKMTPASVPPSHLNRCTFFVVHMYDDRSEQLDVNGNGWR
jgi:hypothetical protein